MYYFDYAASTPPDEDVYKIYKDINSKFFMNSQNNLEALNLLEEGKKKILEILSFPPDYEVVFTSGGTESNNLAIIGKFRTVAEKKHFITTSYEHPSVLESFKELERLGHEVTYLKPNEHGEIISDEVVSCIKKNTALIAIMFVNNELGTVNDINNIFTKVKETNPSIITFTDGVQALGKIPIDYKNIDMISFSSHKIYGPKDVGILIKQKTIVLEQIIYGSKTSIRPGTQSLGAQIAFVNVLNKAIKNLNENQEHVEKLKNILVNELKKNPKIQFNVIPKSNIINISLNIMAQAETIIEYMNKKNIIMSTKSACSKKINTPSHVLQSINIPINRIDRTIRISLSHLTTEEEINVLVKELKYITENF